METGWFVAKDDLPAIGQKYFCYAPRKDANVLFAILKDVTEVCPAGLNSAQPPKHLAEDLRRRGSGLGGSAFRRPAEGRDTLAGRETGNPYWNSEKDACRGRNKLDPCCRREDEGR